MELSAMTFMRNASWKKNNRCKEKEAKQVVIWNMLY